MDNRRDLRYISQHFLEAAGARVATAEDGEVAVAEVIRAVASGTPYSCLMAGCDAYVTKPIQHEAFVEMIAKYTLDTTAVELRARRSLAST